MRAISPVGAELAGRLRWKVSQSERSGDTHVVTLGIAVKGPAILVIDDNEGLIELLDRYLTGHAYRVIAAMSGKEGLQLAQEMIPDAIILDVMMPEMDGWEFLQRLRAYPPTAETPAIICSVINDPELAYSLGASLFLPKPVSRDDVLSALQQLGII
jgi:CheY-like chemotaxis protein